MEYRCYQAEDYRVSNWSGGKTRELAIWPQHASYLDRTFLWRLSSATIENEESVFSRLPDYDRVLMVLKGEVVLSYEGQRVVRLKALEQDRFDGGYKTKSFGKITDFNLMVRKGNEGYLDLLYPQTEAKTYGSTQESTKPLTDHALYCKEGYAVVEVGGQSIMVAEDQLLVMHFAEGETPTYQMMGEGVLIRAQIHYAEMAEEIGPEEIPAEKVSFDDFKTCIYLANVQFRAAKYVVKPLRRQWFDQALSKAIRRVEKFYLTFLAFLAGFVVLLAVLMQNGASAGQMALGGLLWLVIDCLLVSPLIYLPFMPKPVRKHIKDIDQLTPYEQRIRAAEQGHNEQVERLLKKYKNSGKNFGETADNESKDRT